MTTKSREERIFDALVRSTENLSDDQIEAEYHEEGENLETVGSRVRETLLAAVALHQSRERDRIRRERAESLRNLGVFHSRLPAAGDKRRQLLRNSLRQNPRARKEVTAQFRNLNEMTDEDITSALTQLAFLGLLDEEAE